MLHLALLIPVMPKSVLEVPKVNFESVFCFKINQRFLLWKKKIMYMFLCYVYNKAFKENSYRYSTASDFKRKKITHTIQKYKKKYFLELTNSKV